jgi:hypothetical protein
VTAGRARINGELVTDPVHARAGRDTSRPVGGVTGGRIPWPVGNARCGAYATGRRPRRRPRDANITDAPAMAASNSRSPAGHLRKRSGRPASRSRRTASTSDAATNMCIRGPTRDRWTPRCRSRARPIPSPAGPPSAAEGAAPGDDLGVERRAQLAPGDVLVTTPPEPTPNPTGRRGQEVRATDPPLRRRHLAAALPASSTSRTGDQRPGTGRRTAKPRNAPAGE